MAHRSGIEWTEATWNPWFGCHKVSQGCKNCYMFRDVTRYGKDPNTVLRSKTTFNDPLKWQEPRTIFTCSWSDFFIEEADPWRDEAFAIMALTPQHTYQVLTKRPDRMLKYMTRAIGRGGSIMTSARESGFCIEREMQIREATGLFPLRSNKPITFPLPNVHLGVSAEDQQTARTLPSLYQDTGNVGFKRYVRALHELEKDIIPAIYIAMSQMPKIEVLHMYLLIEGFIRVRLNIVEYIPGTSEICWDSTIRQPKLWAVCSGPVSHAPKGMQRRGFQGFRYTEDLW